ncbi:PD-(D/E)XK nuclease family protein [Herpetosiphon giganteus]|uniref:PD-(D/E)XK nuclease family protein n=1 Tax=Herpetosiphon giganteus TaxID=2029754 RepID=UPI00195AC2AE|nr:PD-(D/E)XK nuclease family protein [Herpetosiphon giganteus]MBM7845671.1 hypothetical protein [Herpetosiphon giganteus]
MAKNSADYLTAILSLIHDPRFVQFEAEQTAPTIFNAVGRTHTETWHSALLGWLLDPIASHQLGVYPLQRFLLLLANNQVTNHAAAFDLQWLLTFVKLAEANVRPNERDPNEVRVNDTGRFDVFIDRLKFETDLPPPWKEVQILVEMKVGAAIDIGQCTRYMAHIYRLMQQGIFTIPVYLAPSHAFVKDTASLLGDDRWIRIDFQDLYEEVIEPCLHAPTVSPFGLTMLNEYVKTLRYRLKGGSPLIITQRDQDLVRQLFAQHESAITMLYQILSEQFTSDSADLAEKKSPIQALSAGTQPVKITIQIEQTIFQAKSMRDLYQQVLGYLDQHELLATLPLPIASGSKRYLLATEPIHPTGNAFILPARYRDYYMEANKSRDGGLNDLGKLLGFCGLHFAVL